MPLAGYRFILYGPGNDYWDVNDLPGKNINFYLPIRAGTSAIYLLPIMPMVMRAYSVRLDSYWNDLRGNIIIKLVSVFNIFSRGDYYINSLFFNFVIFFGAYYFVQVIYQIYPGKKMAANQLAV